MLSNSPPAFALAAAASLILLWAAISDIRSRIIPNRAVLTLLAVFAAWAVVAGGSALVPGLEAAAIAFAATFALYAFGVIGAGDSKLFAAAALFFGLDYLPLYALATVLAGGAVAVVSLAARPQRAAVMLSMGGKGDWGRGVPYGVAIAAGAAIVMWGAMTGHIEPYRFGQPAPRANVHDLARTFTAPPPSVR
jgi:prepilin peptidase CpaA